jgi:hypothetical protein
MCGREACLWVQFFHIIHQIWRKTLVGTLLGFENNNTTQYCKLRASPLVLSKIGWRKSVVYQENPLYECNTYDLIAAQCFWLAHHNDWSRWFAISSPPPICCPSFTVSVWWVGLQKSKYITISTCKYLFWE